LKAFCNFQCLSAYTDQNKHKLEKRVKTERNVQTRQQKEKLKSRYDWVREAQAAFNAYVRSRDKDAPCISCGNYTLNDLPGGGWDCGHYRSTGSAPHLRFNLWNAHKQCVKCNRYLSGNVVEYRKGLVNKIGIDKVEQLEAEDEYRKFDINYLKRIKTIFRKKYNSVIKKC
jgi:hypothetical protein